MPNSLPKTKFSLAIKQRLDGDPKKERPLWSPEERERGEEKKKKKKKKKQDYPIQTEELVAM
jgi:hypothetical protein